MNVESNSEIPPRASQGVIDVYVDLRSPYSFVAKDLVRALARDLGVALDWHPYGIDIAATFGADGGRDPRALRKVKYIYMDSRRLSEPRGLVIKGPKKIFDPTLAHIGMLFAKRHGTLDRYLDLVYELFFLRELDVEDRSQLLDTIAESGGERDAAAAYLDGAGPDDLAAATQAAEANGVFGVPSFVWAGELFWGTDRLALLRRTVAGKTA